MKGVEYISRLLVQCAMREELYQRRYETYTWTSAQTEFQSLHIGYRDALKELYIPILKLQAKSICYLSKATVNRVGRDMIKWDDWDSLIKDIETQEAAFMIVTVVWKDTKYEEDCVVRDSHHRERVQAQNVMTIELKRLREVVEETQRNAQRSQILNWLSSNIDPSQNYRAARDKHALTTGDWLTKRSPVFDMWMVAPNSLLWIHGNGKSASPQVPYITLTVYSRVWQIYIEVCGF